MLVIVALVVIAAVVRFALALRRREIDTADLGAAPGRTA
jgi:hypothetical protein